MNDTASTSTASGNNTISNSSSDDSLAMGATAASSLMEMVEDELLTAGLLR